MKILERYIVRTIVLATGMTALIITGVLFLLVSLQELKNIGQGDYGINQVLVYVLLRLPNELYHFAPMLILLGSIIGLSILSSHRELAVMRASGFAMRRIIYSVLAAAFLLILAISLIGESIGPTLSNKAEVRKENAQNAGQAVVTGSGVWFHVDNNFIHIRHVINRQLLEGVTRYQFDDQYRLQVAYYAKKLLFQNKKWQMDDMVKTSFYHGRTKSETFPQADWNLKFNPNLLNVGLIDPSEMPLSKLLKYSRYLEQNGLQSTEFKFDFWQRLFQPLASLVMIFLAIPFVLGTLKTTTLGWRILIGIFAGFAFFISNAVLGQVCIVYQVPTLLAAALPPLVFAIFGIFLSNRLLKQ